MLRLFGRDYNPRMARSGIVVASHSRGQVAHIIFADDNTLYLVPRYFFQVEPEEMQWMSKNELEWLTTSPFSYGMEVQFEPETDGRPRCHNLVKWIAKGGCGMDSEMWNGRLQLLADGVNSGNELWTAKYGYIFCSPTMLRLLARNVPLVVGIRIHLSYNLFEGHDELPLVDFRPTFQLVFESLAPDYLQGLVDNGIVQRAPWNRVGPPPPTPIQPVVPISVIADKNSNPSTSSATPAVEVDFFLDNDDLGNGLDFRIGEEQTVGASSPYDPAHVLDSHTSREQSIERRTEPPSHCHHDTPESLNTGIELNTVDKQPVEASSPYDPVHVPLMDGSNVREEQSAEREAGPSSPHPDILASHNTDTSTSSYSSPSCPYDDGSPVDGGPMIEGCANFTEEEVVQEEQIEVIEEGLMEHSHGNEEGAGKLLCAEDSRGAAFQEEKQVVMEEEVVVETPDEEVIDDQQQQQQNDAVVPVPELLPSIPQRTRCLPALTIEGVANYIREWHPKIIFMVGAGISTAANIPDFRTPGTGLFHKVKHFNLARPEDLFTLSHFKKDPLPFFTIAREIFFQEGVRPTLFHHFMRLVEEKGMLGRCFTQNIDMLESAAEISDEKVVTAHGSANTSTCQRCRRKYSKEWLEKSLRNTKMMVLRCDSGYCDGVVKPDIVFYEEELPERFEITSDADFPKCELLIIAGTSLVVDPFQSLIKEVPPDCPRLLINMDSVGGGRGGLRYNASNNTRDVFQKGTCDEGALKLAELLGWREELKSKAIKGASTMMNGIPDSQQLQPRLNSKGRPLRSVVVEKRRQEKILNESTLAKRQFDPWRVEKYPPRNSTM